MLKYFFSYHTEIPDKYAAGLFTPVHIGTIAILALIFFVLAKTFNNKSDRAKKGLLTVLAFTLPCLEISKMIWDMTKGIFTIANSLPLHLCGLMSIFMPLAVLTQKTWLQEFVYACGMLGGICALTYPYVNIYPPIHYLYIESMMVHSIIMYIPLLMIRFGMLRPDIRSLPYSLIFLVLLAFGATIINAATGSNFFFLRGPALNTPLYYIYDKTGYVGYLAIFIIFVLIMWGLLYLPFSFKKDKPEDKKRAAAAVAE